MSMTELQAQQITLIRVLEQTLDNGGLWSAGDAKEATRAATELMLEKAPFDRFIARRAAWALEEIGKRSPNMPIDLQPSRWPVLAAWLLVVTALAAGFITDHLASDRRVNIVEYPLVGLILWNAVIFLWVMARSVSRLLSPGPGPGGVLSDLLGEWRLAGAFSNPKGNAKPWIDQFRKEWISLSASLNQARLELVLHTSAIFFTLGALASLYVRGFFKEYRAGWESTFFSAETIHAIASVLLSPGALLLNMQIPDVQHVAMLRFPESSGEIARDWIHLYAGSILVWIIIPRFLLAMASGISRWRQQRSFPLPMNGTYFSTLRAIRRGGDVSLVAIPFRYELTPRIKANLAALLEQIYGLAVTIAIRQPVLMGEDARDWEGALNSEDQLAVFVIFNLTATAEPDIHGHLLERVLKDVGGRAPVIPIVDIASYGDSDPERFRQRCNQWCSVLDEVPCKPLFLDLTNPEHDLALRKLEARLNKND